MVNICFRVVLEGIVAMSPYHQKLQTVKIQVWVVMENHHQW